MWTVRVENLEALAGGYAQKKLDCEQILALNHLLMEERLKTTETAVLITLRARAMRENNWSRFREERGMEMSVDLTNLELEQLTGVTRKTAQKVLQEASVTEGLGIRDWSPIGQIKNKTVFRAALHSLGWHHLREIEQVKKRPASRIELVPLYFSDDEQANTDRSTFQPALT